MKLSAATETKHVLNPEGPCGKQKKTVETSRRCSLDLTKVAFPEADLAGRMTSAAGLYAVFTLFRRRLRKLRNLKDSRSSGILNSSYYPLTSAIGVAGGEGVCDGSRADITVLINTQHGPSAKLVSAYLYGLPLR